MKELSEIELEQIQKTGLKPNDFLLKIGNSRKIDTGFLTKLNQNKSIPIKFKEWNNWSSKDLPIFLHEEDYSNQWKIHSFRTGKSVSWAILIHPLEFTIEIHLEKFFDLITEQSVNIIDGRLDAYLKYENKRLIKQ